MPLGNLTSQFFANVYIDEFDRFAKHELKVKYYIRYVDDFIILHHSRLMLENYKARIDAFLKEFLDIGLHPNKSNIIKLDNGITFLGFRLFFYHKLIKKSNMRKFDSKFNQLKNLYKNGIISREKAVDSLEGWLAYISHADSYKYSRHLIRAFNQFFPIMQKPIINNKKDENFVKKVKISYHPFSSQKTLQFFKNGLSIKEIAERRNINESTVLEHLAMLIEYNQLSVWKVLQSDKIKRILPNIKDGNDKLKDIKDRMHNYPVTFDEINCVLAHVKNKNKKTK